jgi:tetratricopeptide (TPR) repeat protein
MNDESASGYHAKLQRGAMLREVARFADAERFLQGAIAEQPGQAQGHLELAICYEAWGDHDKEALACVERAIALAPNEARPHAWRAWILGSLDRERESIAAAQDALRLNPHDILALNAMARAHAGLQEWKESERCAREVLALNAENSAGLNLLSVALRQQGRVREANAISDQLLALVPENPYAQNSAGWAALQAGDHRLANRHFIEALRLDPTLENARRGLVHAFNSRVWLYRMYYQYLAWLGRHKKAMRYVILIIMYVVYRGVVGTLRVHYGHAGQVWIPVVIAIYFIIFGFGRSFGNFFLLLDPFARHALGRKEIILSCLVLVAYGILMLAELVMQAWLPLAILVAIPACFLWAALSPTVQDAWARPARPTSAASVAPPSPG